VKALLAVALFLSLFFLSYLGHIGHGTPYVVVHRGQPLPKHYLAKWSFGNVTIVQVAPDNTTVTVAPWS
jgi:hypothetical protein